MSETNTNLAQDIVHLRQQLAELEITKERYRAIVATAEHVVIGLKPDYTIFEWNKSAEKLYGWSQAEALGQNYVDQFLPKEVRSKVIEDIAKVLAGSSTERYENPVITRDGVRIILWNVTRLLDANAQPYGLIAIGQDITDYKQAEAEAHQSAQKYRHLLAEEQRHVRDLALLDRVRTALARELDLTQLFRVVVEAIAETFGYTLVSLYLLAEDTLILQHQVGYGQVIREIKLTEGVSGRAARTGQPILVQNVKDDATFLGAIEGIVSEVSVPLYDQGVVAGTLNVESVDNTQLTEADLALVTALSEHVSIAIERARLHTEVRSSEERFRIMFESAPIGLAIARMDGRFTQVNPAFCKALGYQADELLAANVADISYPDDMELDRAMQAEMLADNRDSFQMEKRYIAKDGRVLHTILQAALVKDANGEPLYSIGQIVDISDRIQVETVEREQRLLAETLSRVGLALSETLDLSALLNIICRESVNLFLVSSAFVWLVEGDEMVGFAGHGYGRELFIGSRRPLADQVTLAARIMHENRPDFINDVLHSDEVDVELMEQYSCQSILGVPLVKGGEVIGALMILDGQRPFRFAADDLETAAVLASYAAVAIENARLYNDLETRVAERTYELQTAYEELKKLDRLKTKLIDDVSHELRTPTSNVMLYLDLLERGALENQPRYLKVLRAEVSRLYKLVEGIIDLSEVDLLRSRARFAAVDLNNLVKQAVANIEKLANTDGLELVVDLDNGLQPVWGDERQLAEALRHLLANAVSYTQTGQVRIRTFAQVKMCVEIADTGMGIAPEELPHIFDRFYRGQEVSQLSFPGTGLGLFMVKEIIDLHGGEVIVNSQLNEGSTFCICVPVVKS
jgi:PAS domain S-box-containing protein